MERFLKRTCEILQRAYRGVSKFMMLLLGRTLHVHIMSELAASRSLGSVRSCFLVRGDYSVSSLLTLLINLEIRHALADISAIIFDLHVLVNEFRVGSLLVS